MSPAERESFELLAKWDYQATSNSVATAIFFVTYREAIIEAMIDEVGEKGVDYLLKQRYFTNAVDRWYPEADHPVWDNRKTSSREGRADVIRTAFRRAVARLTEELGNRPKEWRWGRLHDMELKHAFGKKAAAFNLEKIEVPGSIAAVWKAHFDLGHPERPFRANYGPVYRMIVDLADMDHAWWVVDTGASGWPLSPHYSDQFELWRQGKYAPMVMNWKEIRKSAKAVLNFVSP